MPRQIRDVRLQTCQKLELAKELIGASSAETTFGRSSSNHDRPHSQRTLSSGQAEVLQRSASGPATDLRFDGQFEYINVVKVHLILFDFAYRFGWTEIPLLPNNLFECSPAIRRPP